jgi:hypothetical protein
MTQLTALVGVLLMITGVAGYVLTHMVSRTALIPAAIGGVLLLLATLGKRESAGKHAMHGALVVALLGIVGSLRGALQLPTLLSGGGVARPAAVYAQAITAVALLVLLLAGIRSFSAARRSGPVA